MVVISAGVGKSYSMSDWEISKWTNDVNVVGFTAIADAAVELFERQGKGKLVGLSSIGGLRGMVMRRSIVRARGMSVCIWRGQSSILLSAS